MPEGVEVRKFADILINNIIGHNITEINIIKGRYTKKVFDGYHHLINLLPLILFMLINLRSLEISMNNFISIFL